MIGRQLALRKLAFIPLKILLLLSSILQIELFLDLKMSFCALMIPMKCKAHRNLGTLNLKEKNLIHLEWYIWFFLYRDGIHLSAEGSKLVIKEILKALREAEWKPSLYWRSLPTEFGEDSIYLPVSQRREEHHKDLRDWIFTKCAVGIVLILISRPFVSFLWHMLISIPISLQSWLPQCYWTLKGM